MNASIYEQIGRNFVEILQLKSQIDFSESATIPVFDPETLLKIRQLLETNYQDGITSIPKAFIDQKGNISGIFEDRINANLTKRYDFEISSGDISYKLLNSDEVANADFSESDLIEFATGPKQKNCTRGTKCGGSCISASKVCRKSMDPEQRKLHEALLRRIGTVDTSLAKKRREAKAARGGGLSEGTIKQKERLAQAQEDKTATAAPESKDVKDLWEKTQRRSGSRLAELASELDQFELKGDPRNQSWGNDMEKQAEQLWKLAGKEPGVPAAAAERIARFTGDPATRAAFSAKPGKLEDSDIESLFGAENPVGLASLQASKNPEKMGAIGSLVENWAKGLGQTAWVKATPVQRIKIIQGLDPTSLSLLGFRKKS